MNEINNNLVFTARLSTEGLSNRIKKWDKVEKIFEAKTSQIDDYELMLFNEGDKIVLSSYDGDLQRFNILSKAGLEKLENLSINGMAMKLAKFLRAVIGSEKKANSIVEQTAKLIGKNKIQEPLATEIFDDALDRAGARFHELLTDAIQKDNLYNNNIQVDVLI